MIMVAVCSINGKLTHGSNPNIYEWTSKEDQKFFFELIQKAKLIVMGSGTYSAVRKKIKHDLANISHSASFASRRLAKLRIVLTNSPDEYSHEQVAGVLEFSSETPKELVCRLEKDYDEMLLVGGAKVYSSFIKAGLVEEIYLTIEPVVFGRGKTLFNDDDFETDLELVSIKKLNKKGTILLKYIVNR